MSDVTRVIPTACFRIHRKRKTVEKGHPALVTQDGIYIWYTTIFTILCLLLEISRIPGNGSGRNLGNFTFLSFFNQEI